MRRTIYTVQKATFCTEVYGVSSHRMDSGCCTYCNQNSINIPTLTESCLFSTTLGVCALSPWRLTTGIISLLRCSHTIVKQISNVKCTVLRYIKTVHNVLTVSVHCLSGIYLQGWRQAV